MHLQPKQRSGDKRWFTRKAINWKPKPFQPKTIEPDLTPAELLKTAFTILHERTKITREQFAKQFKEGGMTRINDLVELFTTNVDSGLVVKDDPSLEKDRQKDMLALLQEYENVPW
jgi:hypothetical protein